VLGLAAQTCAFEVAYPDGRAVARLRLPAVDQGVVLAHGQGPVGCDRWGAREALIFEHRGRYYLHYDGAGPDGWQACLASSSDLLNWTRHGVVLPVGGAGRQDAAAACSPWVIREGRWWHMFYLGTPNASPAPDRIPSFPYVTLKARSRSPTGPWEKQYDVVPFTPRAGTYYSATASPGQVVRHRGEYVMFFSASTDYPEVKRTMGIARSDDLEGHWRIDAEPILPAAEQVENSSLYYEPRHRTWFLFTNHVGINERGEEYTDAIWVYWTRDLERWDARRKAVVLDGQNCSWSKKCLGMPSVVRVGERLAVLYDAPGGESLSHMNRDIALAWLELPLKPPGEPGS
jgi:predicted GH43/DUF377 family glycosyl hydrolase